MRTIFVFCIAVAVCYGGDLRFSDLLSRLSNHPTIRTARLADSAEIRLLGDRGVSTPRFQFMGSVDGKEQQIQVEQMIPRRSELRAVQEMRQTRESEAAITVRQRETAQAAELRKLLISLDQEQQAATIYAEQEKLYGTMTKLMKIRSTIMDESPAIAMAVLDSQMVAQKRISSESKQKSLKAQIELITGPIDGDPVLGETWRQENRPMPSADSSLMVVMAKNETAMSHADVSMAKSGYAPDFMGMVQVERKQMGMDPNPMWQPPMVGVSMTIPLAIGRQNDRVASASAVTDSKKANEESVFRSVTATLADAWSSEQKSIQIEKNYRTILIPESDRLIQLQQQKNRTGNGDIASILMAIRQKQDLQLMAIEEGAMAEMSALMIEEMSGGSRLAVKSE